MLHRRPHQTERRRQLLSGLIWRNVQRFQDAILAGDRRKRVCKERATEKQYVGLGTFDQSPDQTLLLDLMAPQPCIPLSLAAAQSANGVGLNEMHVFVLRIFVTPLATTRADS